MADALVDLANNALGKLGGAGDQIDGDGMVTTESLAADTERVSRWVNDKYPLARKKVNADFAARKCPFRETLKFADLNDDLKQDDLSILVVVSVGGVIFITTDEAHGREGGDTVFLAGIEGTLVTSLNGSTYTINQSFPDTNSFTLTDVTGTEDWDHTSGTGIVSKVPELGPWQYAFDLPSDYFAMVRQTDELFTTGVKKEYQYRTILNRDADGYLLLTNNLTNLKADSAYIEYTFDLQTFTVFSSGFEECIATLLAAELCPVVGRDLETRQAILTEYQALTVREAQRNNQSQFNNEAHKVNDFSGGRSSGGVGVGKDTGLGTYVDAEGNRRDIF